MFIPGKPTCQMLLTLRQSQSKVYEDLKIKYSIIQKSVWYKGMFIDKFTNGFYEQTWTVFSELMQWHVMLTVVSLGMSWSLFFPIWNIKTVFADNGLKLGEQQQTKTMF